MTFGLTFEKMLLIGVIAVMIIGPDRLPKAAETFARFTRRVGEYLRATRTRMREEMGPELDDVDWRKLDPRQYDPRRIIRDALMDDPTPQPQQAPAQQTAVEQAEPAAAPVSRAPRTFTADSLPPYDLEAT